jgi:hypothetical protein
MRQDRHVGFQFRIQGYRVERVKFGLLLAAVRDRVRLTPNISRLRRVPAVPTARETQEADVGLVGGRNCRSKAPGRKASAFCPSS